MTSYIVLGRTGASDPDGWVAITYEEASSASAAIRAALDGKDEGGEFVAVPVRSWKPVKVSIERQFKVKLG